MTITISRNLFTRPVEHTRPINQNVKCETCNTNNTAYEWMQYFSKQTHSNILYAKIWSTQFFFSNLPHWSVTLMYIILSKNSYVLHQSARGMKWEIHAQSHGKCVPFTYNNRRKRNRMHKTANFNWIFWTSNSLTRKRLFLTALTVKTHVFLILYTKLTYVTVIVYGFAIAE